VVAVPILVALTDRVPARNIYVVGAGLTALSHLGFALVADGFWWGLILRAAADIGWAGAYMPGLNVIADTLEGKAQSRAVAAHAAGVGLASASPHAVAGLIASLSGPQAAFLFGGICALIAIAIALSIMPNKPPEHSRSASPRALLDFRPVFRNRAAMAWIAGYTFHAWEMAGLRAWGYLSHSRDSKSRRTDLASNTDGSSYAGRLCRHRGLDLRQRDVATVRPQTHRHCWRSRQDSNLQPDRYERQRRLFDR
jgi:MFS family permease